MSAFDQYEIIDEAFLGLVLSNVKLRQLSRNHFWTEGPVWFPAHNCLLFSDIPAARIYRWLPDGSVSVFRDQSHYANGHTRDPEGRLLSCQHGTRSLTRTEHDGTITTLASAFAGKPLNSPNDVVVKSDGTIWFTDPTYGILSDYEGYKTTPDQPARNVFRLQPDTGEITSVADNFTQPNGLAFSPDESRLYVAESGASHNAQTPRVIRVFDVADDGTLANERDFAKIDPGLPDGMRVDTHGNVWTSAEDGVHCFSPEGKLLGKILVPETVSNLTFGGARNNMMFITATTSVYSLHVNTTSANGR